MWSTLNATCADIVAIVSSTRLLIFLSLDVPTLKLMIIILLTDLPKIILLIALQQKIKLPSPHSKK